MYGEISIQRVDGVDKPVPMLANAATPFRFKQIFGQDLLTLFANAKRKDENGNESYQIDFIGQMAFVMAMQADAADGKIKLEKLNEEKYIDWLEHFESLAIEDASEDIVKIYLGNVASDSEAKKNNEEQSES